MLNSVLLHLPGVGEESPVIELGIALSSRLNARLRGLSVLDTRLLISTEFPGQQSLPSFHRLDRILAFRGVEQLQLQFQQQNHDYQRQLLITAGSSAGIQVDVRLAQGDPRELLSSESRFHDLTLSHYPPPGTAECEPGCGTLACSDYIRLLDRGLQPLLLLRKPPQQLSRVLLVYDGSAASGQTIRKFLSQRLFPLADYRILATGPTEGRSREFLQEMSAYCRLAGLECEAGYVCGRATGVVLPYSARWEADLIVLGVRRQTWRFPWKGRDPVSQILKKTACALYLAS